MKTYEGKLCGKGLKVALVISRFNELFTNKLKEGALDCLIRHDVSEDDIDIVWVPGAFEIPATAALLAKKGAHDAIICLGAVIRGDTPHFDYVASEVSKGVANAGMKSSMPIVFGVLTTDSIDQAIERAGTKSGNKGFSAALAAIEMANLYTVLK